ncbi:unnamed protein product [Protopolystoma xenopodis]|uniref:Uncharacterized protein n=1 Tax=Protopolystoma xenopodis TaxID=117903 RepID=A0A3S5FD30_9PLAT|nr:unnamed protein product [Protopolystoma xenopodis]
MTSQLKQAMQPASASLIALSRMTASMKKLSETSSLSARPPAPHRQLTSSTNLSSNEIAFYLDNFSPDSDRKGEMG